MVQGDQKNDVIGNLTGMLEELFSQAPRGIRDYPTDLSVKSEKIRSPCYL